MQKIVSLFITMMIFGFSLLGEDVHASFGRDESNLSSSSEYLIGSDKIVGPSVEKPGSFSESGMHQHDCHLGHCAFTFFLSGDIGAPFFFISSYRLNSSFRIHSVTRTETIRPPALV